MNCLIVDDEILARDVIEHYIKKVDFLHLCGSYNNAIKAFAHLHKEQVDLIFLDIKMPEMTGLEFIRSLKSPPKIILTTAFHEYALEGFELDVIDYLLKPIAFDRFIKAVNKAREIAPAATPAHHPGKTSDKEFYVRSDRKLIRIDPADIIFIEGMKNYLRIHTTSEKIIIHHTMNAIEEALQDYPYIIRIHKSYIVNKQHIKELDGNLLHLNNFSLLPIGLLYKDGVLNSLKIL